MSIHNRIGISNYQRTMDARIEGSPAESRLPACRPFVNPIPSQVSNVEIGTFDTDTDGVTVTVTEPDGTVHSFGVVRDSDVPVDADAAAAALAVLANAALPGIAVATSATNNLVLTFDHAGIEYTVAATPTVGTTATVTTPTTVTGTVIPLGRFIRRSAAAPDGGAQGAVLASTTPGSAIRGVSMRPLGSFSNLEAPLSSSFDEIPVGSLFDAAYEGAVNMFNAGAAVVQGDPVYAVRSASGGDLVGRAHSAADGTAGVATITPTAAELDFAILVEWTRPDGVTESIPLLSANPDGSATATEICDAFRIALATAQADGVLAGFTAGGTATLTITGPAGQDFRVSDIGEGVSAVAYVAGDQFTVRVPGAYWAEDTAAGAIGPVFLRM
jgi:hypothetical protein